jgi:O-antigen ligase
MPKSKYLTIFNYLIIFFPFTLVTGPLITDSIVLCASVTILFFQNFYLNFFSKFKYFIVYSVIFWLVLILSSFNGSNVLISLKSSIPFIRFFLFILFLIFLFSFSDNLLLKIYKSLFYLLIFLSLDALFQYFTNYNFFGILQNGRLSGMFGDEWILGSFLSKFYGLFLCLNFLKGNKDNFLLNKKNFIKHLLMFFLIYLTIMLTNERAAFFTFNLFAILFLLIKRSTRVYAYIIIVIIFVLNILFYSFNDVYKQRYIIKVQNQFSTSSININYFPNDYAGFFNSSIDIFKKKPLLGSGVRTFRIECKKFQFKYKNSCSTHPHNYYFEILSEVGILGIILMIIFNFYFIKNFLINLLKNKHLVNKDVIYLNLLIIILFQPFTTTGSFFNNWNAALHSFLIAITIYSNIKNTHFKN